MRHSLRTRLATALLVVALATPAFAAPKRDDSPFDQFEQKISNFIQKIVSILDLSELGPPK